MKNVLSTALLSTLAAVGLTASSAHAQNTFEDHEELFNTLREIGVTVSINSKLHCVEGRNGLYSSHPALLVVCQDNMVSHGKQEFWTENDLDTLRHEAHHVVQDCAADSIGDGTMTTLFDDEGLVNFLSTSPSYSMEDLKGLYSKLYSQGLSVNVIAQEMEAYVVARDIPASSITTKLRQFCF